MKVMDFHHKSNMGIIDKVKKNIKDIIYSSWVDEAFWLTLIIFVAIGSFSLGMRHQRELFLKENPVYIKQDNRVISAWKNYILHKKTSAHFFASKNGTVYYPLACPSGDRVIEENRIYFETEDEAQNAGYKQSKRCY